jgi:hypothetical protein
VVDLARGGPIWTIHRAGAGESRTLIPETTISDGVAGCGAAVEAEAKGEASAAKMERCRWIEGSIRRTGLRAMPPADVSLRGVARFEAEDGWAEVGVPLVEVEVHRLTKSRSLEEGEVEKRLTIAKCSEETFPCAARYSTGRRSSPAKNRAS